MCEFRKILEAASGVADTNHIIPESPITSFRMAASDVKVVLLGEAGVGKSSLMLRFVNNEFKQFIESTIGASFMSKTARRTSAERRHCVG